MTHSSNSPSPRPSPAKEEGECISSPARREGDCAPSSAEGGDAFSAPGLLLKLVLLPALMVLVLVAVFVVIGWLTHSSRDVDSLVDSLEKRGNRRWRAAVDLAGALGETGSADLKNDPLLAGRLAEILRREIESGGLREEQITLRMYLCRALGEFHVSQPLPVLLQAATTERDPREADVRRSAIEAIAVLASNDGSGSARWRDEVISALVEGAEDARPPLRSAAAFALGVIGGSEAEAKLEVLLGDAYPDVRYNAATGLARHGNVAAVDVLLEMLDPNESAGIEVEKQEAARDFKRAMILTNALRATSQLASANPTADLSRLREAVDRLTRSDVEAPVRAKAIEILSQLRSGATGAREHGRHRAFLANPMGSKTVCHCFAEALRRRNFETLLALRQAVAHGGSPSLALRVSVGGGAEGDPAVCNGYDDSRRNGLGIGNLGSRARTVSRQGTLRTPKFFGFFNPLLALH